MDLSPQLFLRFEEQNNMFHREICGIHYWHLIRLDLFNHLCDDYLGNALRHPDLEKNKQPKIKNAVKLIYNALCNKHSLKDGEGKILFSASCRKRKDQAELLLDIDPSAFLLIDRPINFGHLLKSTDYNLFYPDWIEFWRGIYITFQQRNPLFLKKVREEVSEWTTRFDEAFGTSIAFNKICAMVAYSVSSQRILRPYFYKKLKKYPPRAVIVSPYYENFNMPMIYVAKKLGIKVIELQHGALSKYHLAYNFDRIHEDYLPDNFLFYGEYWKNTIVFPDKDRITVCGSVVIEDRTKHYADPANKANGILVISQGPYSDTIFTFTKELSKAIHDNGLSIRIYYKLHPSEINTWAESNKAFENDNVSIETGDFYELMPLVSSQIGVDSTAIYEGLKFDLATFIIDCPFLKAGEMRAFCEDGYGVLVSDANDVLQHLYGNTAGKRVNSSYYWQQDASANLKQYLQI